MNVSNEQDIVRANPRARAIAIASIVLAVAAGGPVLYATRAYLERLTALAKTDAPAAIAGFKTWVLPQVIAIAAIGAAAGSWTIREGVRTYRAERYPRPDMWVLHDTPVRRGRGAHVIAVWLMAAGAVLAAAPVLIVVVLLALLAGRG